MEQAAKGVRAILLENTDAEFYIILQAGPVWDREMCFVSFFHLLMRWQLPVLIALSVHATPVANWTLLVQESVVLTRLTSDPLAKLKPSPSIVLYYKT